MGTVIRPDGQDTLLTTTEQIPVNVTAGQTAPIVSAFSTVEQSGFPGANVELILPSSSNPVALTSQLVLDSAASISSDTDSDTGPENPKEEPNSSEHVSYINKIIYQQICAA